jgi:hypothetical protein
MTADTFTCVRVEGSVLPVDLLQRVAAGDARLEGLRAEDYRLDGEKLNEATNHAWTRLTAVWDGFAAARDRLPDADDGARLTVEKWLLPFWRVLGYGTLDKAPPVLIDEKAYPVSHVRYHSPVHLVSFRQDLDKRAGAEARQFSPHGLVQEFLNRSGDHLWGFVSNGLRLRVLRDNIRLSRQAFVEFDLQAMFDGRQYADFALLWRLCHESRVHAERPERCWLERWHKAAAEQGLRALDQLRTGVENAVKALGRGFLGCPANAELKAALRQNRLTPLGYYRQLLRVVYRLLFLFVAEDRELLLDPKSDDAARGRYARFYSAARLRRVAERLRGGPHTDLYEGLSLVLDRLGTTGCPDLALPALGGLFDPARTPELAGCRIANADLLDAVRALAVVSDGQARRRVDYRNLGAEELGSVYESLLELHPRFDPDAITFILEAAGGNERKTTGTYYTPPSLITCLLDSALDPVLNEAARRPNPEDAILALRVCDPACGSGHFLRAAAHRIAKRLAAVRTFEDEPAPDAVRHALRDVIGRCVYGVDINPMAVELCHVALWMEALEPGRPLSFLEHHVQCGNSLLGATPALLACGIPDDAFEPIEGDDKKWCSALKRQNKEDRNNQPRMFEDAPPGARPGSLPAAMARLENLPDDTAEGVHAKERAFAALRAEEAYRTSGHYLADAWCAAFVWKKVKGDDLMPMTHKEFRRVEQNPDGVGPREYAEVRRLAEQYQFFHWHLAFPCVFRLPAGGESPENAQTGWSGGFDVVLGNPPWERIKLQEQEWFAAHGRPEIAGARTAAIRGRLIQELATSDNGKALYRAFIADRRKAEGESHLVRDSSGIDDATGRRRGMFPLCGRGDVNTYSLFAELNRNLIKPAGRVGCIVPGGIATDDTTKAFFKDLVEARSLASLFGFENEEFLFPGVHHSTKFCLLTLAGKGQVGGETPFVFFARRVEDLAQPGRRFTLSPDDLRLLNPNTGTCPVFRTAKDAELTKGIYRRVPVLLKDAPPTANPWGVRFLAMLHMANDSALFKTAADLQADGWRLEGNVYRKGGAEYLPLYEAKMFHQFDHRWGTYEGQTEAQANQGKLPELTPEQHAHPNRLALPRYWVPANAVEDRLKDRWERAWLLGWRDIARNTDARTVIAGVLPRVGVGHTSPLMHPDAEPQEVAALYANLCSFVFDYASRQKIGGTHLTIGLLNQLPALHPDRYAESCPWAPEQTLSEWVVSRVLELVFTAWDLKPFAQDCGYGGDPFVWDDDRRFQLRCELDAAYLLLYGLGMADAEYILDTFPVIRDRDTANHGSYRTKETVLAIARDMAEGVYESPLDPPAGSAGPSADPSDDLPRDLFGDPVLPPLEKRLIQAFVETRDGWSSEYVVCDPDANRRFLDRVRQLAPNLSEGDANRMLWNARRSGKLSHLPKSRKYSPDRNLLPFEFVCEWAYRHLIADLCRTTGADRKHTTLERILCIPDWRAKFDELVTRIRPGFDPLDYRWVSMTVRKRSGEKQRAKAASLFDETLPVAEAPRKLPDLPGVYLIRSAADDQLYTGWTPNLREQANRLIDTGQGRVIPDWLLPGTAPAATVSFQPLEPGAKEAELHDLWRSNLHRRKPLLNLFDELVA